MSTLTQFDRRLPAHCPHKLPASCRLTARPTCCACQDDRPHASHYRKYIDGVGFVMLGTRHDGYCWPCKVFWDVRIAAAQMQPEQARIPFIPDQTEFVNTWHDWHRGYRVISLPDGAEQVQQLHGQPLNHVDIGSLPIPNSGTSSTDPRAVRWIEIPAVPETLQPRQQEVVAVAPEDRLFDSDEEDTTVQQRNQGHQNGSAQAQNQQSDLTAESQPRESPLTAGDARNLLSLSHRLENLMSSITSTTDRLRYFQTRHDLHDNTEDLSNTIGQVIEAADALVARTRGLIRHETLLHSLRSARLTTTAAQPAATNQRTAVQQANRGNTQGNSTRQSRNETIAARLTAAFGTREEVQQPDYESPINLLFNRAQTYGRRMEAQRQEQLRRQSQEQQARQRELLNTRRLVNHLAGIAAFEETTSPDNNDTGAQESSEALRPGMSDLSRRRQGISGGIHVTADGLVHHVNIIDETVKVLMQSSTIRIIEQLGPMILVLLRGRCPRSEGVSPLRWERLLWNIVADFLNHAINFLDNLSLPSSDEQNLMLLQDTVETLLQDAFPRRLGEDLRRYYARITDVNDAEGTATNRRNTLQALPDRPPTWLDDALLRRAETVTTTEAASEVRWPNNATIPPVVGRMLTRRRNEVTAANAAAANGAPASSSQSNPLLVDEALDQLSAHLESTPDGFIDAWHDEVRSHTDRIINILAGGNQELAHVISLQAQVASHTELMAHHRNELRNLQLNGGNSGTNRAHLERTQSLLEQTQLRVDQTRASLQAIQRDLQRGGFDDQRASRGGRNRGAGLTHRSQQSQGSLPLIPPQRPLEPSEMTITLQCTVCQEQLADIALVPCGHLIMCRWCSERHELMGPDSTCPICRARIRYRLRVWGLADRGQVAGSVAARAIAETGGVTEAIEATEAVEAIEALEIAASGVRTNTPLAVDSVPADLALPIERVGVSAESVRVVAGTDSNDLLDLSEEES